jgi:hypothetical protein
MSCESWNKKTLNIQDFQEIIQDIQEKTPTNQEEALKSEIKELEIQRKKQITQLMDAWKGTEPLDDFAKLLKQGDIEAIYQGATKDKTEAEIGADLSTLRHTADNEKEDYSATKASKAILEKDLYKLYECYFSEKYINKNTKKAVDKYFKKLEEKEKNSAFKKEKSKKRLQLLRNWKTVEPILKLEQEKRESLKQLQEANKA